MSSPGQRRGKCGHVMANFDTHSHCARCRDKGKGKEPCVSDPQTSDCQICNSLTSEQLQQLSTPSYKIKKEKREAKLSDATPSQDSEQLVDPSSVSVIGVVDRQGSVKSPAPVPPPDKKPKTDNKHSVWYKFKCKASCCLTCSFCTRAFSKERIKSRVSRLSLQKLQIKVCEKCFLCHSIVLCSTCNNCHKCCTQSACRGKTSEILENLAGSGSRPKSSSDPKRGLHPSLPDPAKAHKVTQGYQLLCQSELVPKQIFDFVGYRFDLRAGRVRPTPDRWQNLQDKILEIMSLPHCPVRQFLDLVYQTSSNSKSPTYPRAAECGSRQAIQAGPDHSDGMVPPSRGFPSYMQQVAPTSDLFATRFNNKLPQFVSPVPDPLAVVVDALSLPWENLDAYAFPPAAILGKVVERLQDSPCKRIILIAPGWPNMPWFWDLVTMSSQIPLSLPNLPNLLTQPFNQIPHRNLTNLNLHAWLLEPQQSRSRASLKQWQQGLRLLKEDQPDLSMRQSGPFLQSGASLIRWTSGHPL